MQADLPPEPLLNQVLRHAPAVEQALEELTWPANAVIHDAGDSLRYVHFIVSGLVSMCQPLGNGSSLEVALLGPGELAGISVLRTDPVTAWPGAARSITRTTARTRRLRRDVLEQALESQPLLQRPLIAELQALIRQMAQIALCGHYHSLYQQLCRNLLLCLDRIDGDSLPFTHEHLAQCLGVRRAGVSTAADRLRRQGLIRYQRGRIQVLDRPALEQACCECYSLLSQGGVEKHHHRKPHQQ